MDNSYQKHTTFNYFWPNLLHNLDLSKPMGFDPLVMVEPRGTVEHIHDLTSLAGVSTAEPKMLMRPVGAICQ